MPVEAADELLDELPRVVPELAAAGFVTDGADCDLKPSSSTSTATVLVTARMTRRMEVSELSRALEGERFGVDLAARDAQRAQRLG